MNASHFPYRPLQAQTQEIRIIQVLPLAEESNDSSQVHCKLKHVHLTDEPEYCALSYVWGDPQAKSTITLDDRQVGVTVNLETVLRQLAGNLRDKRDNHLDLWVDALCIDQANAHEKTQQVSLMNQIYNKATQTIFWLGTASDDSNVAIECLEWLSTQRQQNFRRVLSWTQVQFDPEADLTSDVGTIQSSLDVILAVLCSDDMRRLRALGALFDRQWFRRVWVLQEAALSTSGVGMIGAASFDAYDLECGFNLLCGLRDYLRMVPIVATADAWQGTTSSSPSAVADFLTQKLGSATAVVFSRGALYLRQLLYLLANPDAPLEASDERDYVFALLGLATDAEELGTRSDYSKNWSQIRVNVAKACLKHYGYGMEVLFFCKSRPGRCPSQQAPSEGFDARNENTGEDVPSWAPDWSPLRLPRPLSIRSRFSFLRGGGRRNAYNACGNTKSNITDESFLPNGVLALCATRVDPITLRGSQLTNSSSSSSSDNNNNAALAAYLTAINHTFYPAATTFYKTFPLISAALYKTPIADRSLVHNYEPQRTSAGDDALLQQGYVDLLNRRTSRDAARYADIARYKLCGRRPFATARGMLGLGPVELREGDVVWVLWGADVPFVLRREGGGAGEGRWSVVGEAYVHGIMDGEATTRTGPKWEEIHLV
ncbi:heterokaryon incompatibility protein-domain-containing protein [Phyllosticta citribraziliensis]|uniref:Heterokaryon incompatibility protein-domain-containing protein n=1 Tax=Phyllosticta citribraziliensis TaxID=989973 RepID=A0ABR1L6S4_9PEZI